MPPAKKRLLALDILRGITIAGMILVNNQGSGAHIYAPLAHANWNGLTPTDLIFPFFMFIMGISTYMSMRSYDFRLSGRALLKIVRRTMVIFLIGMFIAWFGLTMRGLLSEGTFMEAVFNFDRIRILGVMPRLALCYGIGSVLALWLGTRRLPWLIGGMLAVYAVLLLLGNGYDIADNNIISIVDYKVLGENHMYGNKMEGMTLRFDPEGLLSTLPSVAHMLIGYLCGYMIMGTKDNSERINRLFIVGTILTFCGFLLSYGLPINKKVWSPTFVLTTCGLAASFLGLLIWIIDIKGHKRWCRFFEAFGINPLFMYCLGAILGIVLRTIRVPFDGGVTSLAGYIYRGILVPALHDPTLASLVYAILFVMVNWIIGYILYKKKIYIKI